MDLRSRLPHHCTITISVETLSSGLWTHRDWLRLERMSVWFSPMGSVGINNRVVRVLSVNFEEASLLQHLLWIRTVDPAFIIAVQYPS